MNLSRPFIERPIATILLTLGIALGGIGAFFALPVAPLPQVDFPVITVSATLPGGSPDTMASTVATPLERHLGTIAGVTEMTSQSGVGSTRINLQFDLNRDIDAMAREVQAAISATRADLPATLKSTPGYDKANPAAAPVLILALTSRSKTPGQIYDAVSNLVQQKISQVKGVGEVEIGGGSLPAVRVELLPYALNKYGISMEDVRAALQASNANRPKGVLENAGGTALQIYSGANADRSAAGGGRSAASYAKLVVAWRNGSAVRLQDVAEVVDGVENTHTLGLFNNFPAIVIIITRQPGANIIETVDNVRALLPQLRQQVPGDIQIDIASDSTGSIRTSLRDVEGTLVISVILVVLVVSMFLRSLRATIVPAVATVVSLLGTFGVMYLLGYSLNNLSLMALTVATGFVVDDAIVVLENTQRHIEAGMDRFQAALLGAREVGFTVISISLSLVAVFIPLLFLGGIAGRLFREFSVTLAVAIMISLVISLTTTPMMCAWLLQPNAHAKRQGRFARAFERAFDVSLRFYEHCLDWALQSAATVMLLLAFAIGLNVYLFAAAPKGFFPQQDSGQIQAGIRADESISFAAMQEKLRRLVAIIKADPDVEAVTGFTGGSRAGGGFSFISLKPLGERKVSGQTVIDRLKPQLADVTGVSMFLNTVQDLGGGGARSSNATYQYTLKSDNAADLRKWSAKLADQMKRQKALTDVDSDQADNGVETFVHADRASAKRLGLSITDVDNALYDGFGQRQVSTIYNELNQYHVIMEVAPQYQRSPEALKDVYVPVGRAANTIAATSANNSNALNPDGSAKTNNTTALRDASTGNALSTGATTMVPLSAFARFSEDATATSVNHQDGELATTVSFNLANGFSLSQGQDAVRQAEADIAMPINVRGSFAGTALAAQQNNSQMPILLLSALGLIYLVLGVLYESLIHPLTVLSTLPSAGVGAILALLMFKMDLSVIAIIAMFLLIGIVKKNAILIIDFALEAERQRGLNALAAVREASLLRFRPIMMTTLAAMLGALPLAIGFGEGSELRQPLGVAIIGGLVASQLLTLLTTPVVYILLDKLRRRSPNERQLSHLPHEDMDAAAR